MASEPALESTKYPLCHQYVQLFFSLSPSITLSPCFSSSLPQHIFIVLYGC